jgi:hypothetical protein
MAAQIGIFCLVNFRQLLARFCGPEQYLIVITGMAVFVGNSEPI